MSDQTKNRRSTAGGSELNSNPFGGLKSGAFPERAVSRERESKNSPTNAGRVELRREKSGRGGKTVTTISAFATQHTQRDLEILLKELKQACACGGVRRERVLELQGDLREAIFAELANRGFKPVLAGG